MLPVTLMTVLESGSKLPLCRPATTSTQTNDISMVTVDDRTAEIALMDNDPSTCLHAFINGSRSLGLIAYIYVPSCMSNVHVMLHIFGLACTHQSITVYHHLPTAKHHGVFFHECIPVMTGNEHDHLLQCEFACQNICAESAIMKVGIHIVKMTWKMMVPVRVCGINVTKYPL